MCFSSVYRGDCTIAQIKILLFYIVCEGGGMHMWATVRFWQLAGGREKEGGAGGTCSKAPGRCNAGTIWLSHQSDWPIQPEASHTVLCMELSLTCSFPGHPATVPPADSPGQHAQLPSGAAPSAVATAHVLLESSCFQHLLLLLLLLPLLYYSREASSVGKWWQPQGDWGHMESTTHQAR